MTLTAAVTYGMLPLFGLMLVDYRTLIRPQCWQRAWKRVPIHTVRIAFALSALVIVALDGLDSAHLQWTGKSVRSFSRKLQTKCSGELHLNRPVHTPQGGVVACMLREQPHVWTPSLTAF